MLRLEPGDVFVLATDGIYEHLSARRIAKAVNEGSADLDAAARGSSTRLSRLAARTTSRSRSSASMKCPTASGAEVFAQPRELPLPPLLEPRAVFDGYRIVRELHGSSRSHIYLAVDIETDAVVTIKIPSIDLRDDPAYLKRFMMEEWVARRIDSPHVLKPCLLQRKRNFLYVVTEYIDGQTLAQWMIDNPSRALETVRGIVEQIAKGLRAFHRKEMLHQDLRPENIMIDATGTVKIIDFGSTRVTGVVEAAPSGDRDDILGTRNTPRPNIFWASRATSRSDLFSLGVITYQMLTGGCPTARRWRRRARGRSSTGWSTARRHMATAKCRNGSTARWRRRSIPIPYKRYDSLSEFLFDLRHPNANYLSTSSTPLIERNPLLFWKCTTIVLALAVVVLLAMHR